MFLITVGDVSVLYTGDFTMEANHVLRSAWVDACRPTLLITESTLACMVHDVPRRALERQLLRAVRGAVERGGKVLVPSFAVGRAHELAALVQAEWRWPRRRSRGGAEAQGALRRRASRRPRRRASTTLAR